MDKKKKINMRVRFLLLAWLLSVTASLFAQDVSRIGFCGRGYKDIMDNDSITLYLKLFDNDNEKAKVNAKDLNEQLHLYEDGNEIMPLEILSLNGGLRIPKEYTFSVLVDLNINSEGKQRIYDALGLLVRSAPDSCVYVSFFGDGQPKSKLVTGRNYNDFENDFKRAGKESFLYSAIHSRLLEFDKTQLEKHTEYLFESAISERAEANSDKVIFFIFVDGTTSPDNTDYISYRDIIENQDGIDKTLWPKTYAFYYVPEGCEINDDVESTLDGITGSSRKLALPEEKQGKYSKIDNIDEILKDFGEIVRDQMYDFAFIYKASKTYSGEAITYTAKWNDTEIGDKAVFSIGAPENPWPKRSNTTSDFFMICCIAVLVTFLTIFFFFSVMKILIPFVKSKSFSTKYYKTYVPEDGVQKKLCYYCKQPILPGQKVVTKCKHIMHVECWKQNDYRCSEYGQNCNIGIQEHVDWQNIFTTASYRDCLQTISGILSGFVSWVIYEISGRGIFDSLSAGIADMFLTSEPQRSHLLQICTSKVASFLAIGLILGFFLSLVFRWNEEYRKKDATIYLSIIGLSLLSSLIGFLAFAFGGIILCMIVSSISALTIPWYCSLPAYILFSVCTSLSLTIKTSIPIKSAMLGGLCSSVIGFLVLYFSKGLFSNNPWVNILLDFIIYGGGLGASLVTVRMLAEKYFLVITNGIKAGTRIPIHKWMNASGGGNKVSIGMTGECEIQMNWEKSNKVAKEHAMLYIDPTKSLPVIKPLATGVIYNSRAELPLRRQSVLSNGDTIKIGDTIFRYEETD